MSNKISVGQTGIAHQPPLNSSAITVEKFTDGLSDFASRLWTAPSAPLIAELLETYQQRGCEQAEPWSLDVPRDTYLQAVLLAQELETEMGTIARVSIASSLRPRNSTTATEASTDPQKGDVRTLRASRTKGRVGNRRTGSPTASQSVNATGASTLDR